MQNKKVVGSNPTSPATLIDGRSQPSGSEVLGSAKITGKSQSRVIVRQKAISFNGRTPSYEDNLGSSPKIAS